MWRVVGGSATGVAHLANEVPCQDAYGYEALPGGVVLAVADGAGSAARSDEGARLVVERALAVLSAAGEDGAALDEAGWAARMTEAFRAAGTALGAFADEQEISLRELATTLTCAVALDDRLIVGQVGDGLVVAEGEDGALFSASRPRKGEYANETHFLTMSCFLDYLDIEVYPRPVTALAASTDGLLRLALTLPAHTPFKPFFGPLLAFAREVEHDSEGATQLAAFLASERVAARTDDDTTLVLAVRQPNDPPAATLEPDSS